MSRDQLDQVGAVLAAHVDMVKGFLGDQYSVSIVARHNTGPFHLLLGDDTELTLIGCLSELQRIGTPLVRDGVTVDTAEPTVADHMANLLQEAAELSLTDEAGLIDLQRRIEQVLDMLPPKVEDRPSPAAVYSELLTEDEAGRRLGAMHTDCGEPGHKTADCSCFSNVLADQLTEVRPCPIGPPVVDLAPQRNVCPRCVEPLERGATECPVCKAAVHA